MIIANFAAVISQHGVTARPRRHAVAMVEKFGCLQPPQKMLKLRLSFKSDMAMSHHGFTSF